MKITNVKVDLIVETDLGHDLDDFLALCYLVAAGARIRAITVVPGHPYQIALGRLLARELGLEIPIGFATRSSKSVSSTGVHRDLLARYGSSADADGQGVEVISHAWKRFPRAQFFVSGPVTNVARWIAKERPDLSASRATMQGGFVPYYVYWPAVALDKFKGRGCMPTFNLDGNRSASAKFIDATFACTRFVGKNVCHTIVYDRRAHRKIDPHNRAGELFREAMDLYLRNHGAKKFHDPTAAVCHLHPEIGVWLKGKPELDSSGWTFAPRDRGSTYALCDLDRARLWDRIAAFN